MLTMKGGGGRRKLLICTDFCLRGYLALELPADTILADRKVFFALWGFTAKWTNTNQAQAVALKNCGSLNENVHSRLVYWNTCPQLLGLFKEVQPARGSTLLGWGLRVYSLVPLPVPPPYFPLLPTYRWKCHFSASCSSTRCHASPTFWTLPLEP